eukprot:c13921_g1_i2.p1 GENE.c13921_g1_i2~~c13921_g1_i2.p1  ORF type:complete len:221 (+),score=34.83 c13921_g1_i2:160-822(+)
MEHVEWEAGSALDQDKVRDVLSRHRVRAIVHAVGAFIDGSAPAPLLSAYRLFKGDNSERTLSLEEANRDSALLVASEAAAAKVERFVFLSSALVGHPAGNLPPVKRYVEAKRQVEEELASYKPETLECTSIRMGQIYDDFKFPAQTVAFAAQALSLPSRLLALSALPSLPRPIHVHVAAACAVECCIAGRTGLIEGEEVWDIAENAGVDPTSKEAEQATK